MKHGRKVLIFKTCAAVVSAVMLILSCIFLRALPKYILLGAFIAFSSLGVIITNTDYSKNETIFKTLLVTLISMSVVLIAYIALESAGVMAQLQDTESLIKMIRGTRHWGIIIFIVFIVFEIVFLPLPGAVAAFIGSVLYGPLLGFTFITIGTIIGSIICFALGKVFGKKLVEWMIGEQKTKQYADLLNEKGRFVFILMLLFPFFPDDILCLAAGMTSMSYRYFITVICLTRPFMIAFMSYFIEGKIIPFTGWGIPVWIGIAVGSLVLFFFISKLKRPAKKGGKKG